jgi:flagellar protein FlaG
MTSDVRLHSALPPVTAVKQPGAVSGPSRSEARAFEAVDRLPTQAERTAEKAPAPQRELAELVGELKELVQAISRKLEFSVDEESGRTVIKVLDSETGEVIRQIPPEEVLTLVDRFKDHQAGLLTEQA